jgi:hypothetical protein
MAIQSANPPDIMTLNAWKGLNQQSKRGSIDDEEEWWNENLFAIGPGNLRSCWGLSEPIFQLPPGGPAQIVRMFFGFYGNNTPQFGAPPPGAMGWMFLSNGQIVEVDLNTKAITYVNGSIPCWSPIAPQYWASAKVWRPQFYGASAGQQGGVLFGSPAGLYAWDGQNTYGPGSPAPDWLTDLQESDPGATPPNMPTGLPGIYAMEVYQARLWVAGKDVIAFSAPSNGADFSTTDGGGSFGYFGDRLAYSYMDLCQSAGYLFVFGDSSTDLISNIQLTGSGTPESPYTTNFNYENIDPQVGQRFPRPVGRYGRYMTMFNGAGIFLMQGGDAQPVGDKVTTIWNTLDTSLYLPTFAPATMFGFRVMLCNGRFTDPWGVTRNLLLMWHPTKGHEFWSVASQEVQLTQIGAYEQDSVITPYGTDGYNLYQLFAQPSPTLTKRLSTKKLRGGQGQGQSQLTVKNFKRVYAELDDNSGLGVALQGTLTSGGGGVPGGVQAVDFQLSPGGVSAIIPSPVEGAGIWGALDLQSISPDFTLERIHIAAEERTLFGA